VKRVAVFGAGNAGQAAAAHLTKMGLEVRLYNRWANEIEAIKAAGGINLKGVLGEGFYKIPVITTDIREAADGADFFWVATPAVAHEFLAAELAPLLPEGAHVFLNPGSTGGALAFAHALKKNGGPKNVVIGETNTNIYITRITGPAQVTVWNLGGVLFSVFPAKKRDEIFSEMSPYFKNLVPSATVLDTAFANVNAVMHPAGTLMNAGWIEKTNGAFRFYTEGGTPGVGAVIDQLERERTAAMAALGVYPKPFVEVFFLYGATSKEAVQSGSCYVALRDSEANKEIMAPPSLKHRFITEDVPFGIVPYKHLATLGGVQTPIIDSLITLASVVSATDWLSKGLTLEKMGLTGVTKYTLMNFLREGTI
jgi:opine dehydrogenase